MAKITSNIKIANSHKEVNKINQGDIIHCNTNGNGGLSFWAIYGHNCGAISLDGGGNCYLPKEDLYLFETYSYWTIDYRIPCNRVKINIEEEF